MAAGLARLDAARDLNGPGKEQQLFSKRGFAGIGVGNHGECASSFDFVRNAHESIVMWSAGTALRGAALCCVGNGNKQGQSPWITAISTVPPRLNKTTNN